MIMMMMMMIKTENREVRNGKGEYERKIGREKE
jgi:hypothetical protein